MFRNSSTLKLISLILFSIISPTALTLSAQAQEKGNTGARQDAVQPSISIPDSNKEQDGLIGPVRQVRTVKADLSMKFGKLTEGPRSLLSTTTYNPQGNSIDNTYYLGTERNRSVGKEEYKYDDKGNVTEVTLRNNHGAILSREVFTYEFDVVGNWNKMVTSVVINDRGNLTYEPVEVTYRNISYYFTEAIATFERSTSSQKATTAVSSPADTPRDAKSDGHPIGNETVARSDDNGKSRSIVPRGTTVSNRPATDSSPAGARVTGNQEVEEPSIIKADGDLSEDRMSKPQARLFSDSAANNKVVMIPNATYPDEAKRAGVTGTVVVIVEINTEGKVVSARAASGHSALRAAAVEAALKAHFSPTLLKNQTPKRSSVISFTFSLL